MKAFEVRIRKTRTGGECRLEWPSWWGDVCKQVNVLAYQSEGLPEEGAVCVCDDAVWAVIAERKDPLITELTDDQANEKGRAWRPQVQRITDQEAVLMACAEAASGKSLTGQQKKALDPDDPTPGIGKSKLFDIRKGR